LKFLSEKKARKLVADEIRFARVKRRISQEDLASMCDLSRTSISSAERSESTISWWHLYKLMKALEIKWSELDSIL
jgi:transcriptional regulator with XRE-family HTH domain